MVQQPRVPRMFCQQCEMMVPVLQTIRPRRGPLRWLGIRRFMRQNPQWYCTRCGTRRCGPAEIRPSRQAASQSWNAAVRRAIDHADALVERKKI